MVQPKDDSFEHSDNGKLGSFDKHDSNNTCNITALAKWAGSLITRTIQLLSKNTSILVSFDSKDEAEPFFQSECEL